MGITKGIQWYKQNNSVQSQSKYQQVILWIPRDSYSKVYMGKQDSEKPKQH